LNQHTENWRKPV